METFKVPSTSCPACSERLEACTSTIDDKAPKLGDATVCAYCLGVLIFGEGLELHIATREELDTFEPALRAHLAKLQTMLALFPAARKDRGLAT